MPLGLRKSLVSAYIGSKIEKHNDYFINNMKEMPEIWSNVFMNMYCINKNMCKLACEYLPYIESMVTIIQTRGMPANNDDLELFLRTTDRMIKCHEYVIGIILEEDNYYIFNRRNGKVVTRDIGYMLNNKYTKINFRAGIHLKVRIEWDYKMYDLMKLLIRKQKVIKPAKNYSPSNADALEKWKLNFMRSFEYHNNLHKLKLSCKI